MSIATIAKPARRDKPARARRRAARLELVIAGISYELQVYRDDDAGRSLSGWEHVLRAPGGRPFAVYDPGLSPAELRALIARDPDALFVDRFHCEACRAPDCVHVNALVEVGLL